MGNNTPENIEGNEAGDLLIVEDLCKKAAIKQKNVDDLKYDYERIQLEVKIKMDELRQLKESNSRLEGYLNSRQYMLDELQKSENSHKTLLHINQETAAQLREDINKVREIKNEEMTTYENKVAAITETFINGPYNFSPEVMSEKKKVLIEIHGELKKELVNIQNDLDEVHKKFNLEEYSVICEKESLAQLEAMKALERKEIEEEKSLEEELKMLGKMSANLQKELLLLKQHEK